MPTAFNRMWDTRAVILKKLVEHGAYPTTEAAERPVQALTDAMSAHTGEHHALVVANAAATARMLGDEHPVPGLTTALANILGAPQDLHRAKQFIRRAHPNFDQAPICGTCGVRRAQTP
ncbi:hypothetical protein AB0N09_28055 [Streptomyces erythrochromogenes]|uniref:hypothetical protein n=1 Tax=Streptomyces erythrochromogenes TaxID=285574 RepID=UPI003420CDAD